MLWVCVSSAGSTALGKWKRHFQLSGRMDSLLPPLIIIPPPPPPPLLLLLVPSVPPPPPGALYRPKWKFVGPRAKSKIVPGQNTSKKLLTKKKKMNETTNFFHTGLLTPPISTVHWMNPIAVDFVPSWWVDLNGLSQTSTLSSKRPISPILGGRPIVTILADWIPLDGSFDSLTQTKSTRRKQLQPKLNFNF